MLILTVAVETFFLFLLQDGNGFISRHELAVVMSNMGETLSREEIQVHDLGVVSIIKRSIGC